MKKRTKDFLKDFEWMVGMTNNQSDFLMGAYELAIEMATTEDDNEMYEIADEIDAMI